MFKCPLGGRKDSPGSRTVCSPLLKWTLKQANVCLARFGQHVTGTVFRRAGLYMSLPGHSPVSPPQSGLLILSAYLLLSLPPVCLRATRPAPLRPCSFSERDCLAERPSGLIKTYLPQRARTRMRTRAPWQLIDPNDAPLRALLIRSADGTRAAVGVGDFFSPPYF